MALARGYAMARHRLVLVIVIINIIIISLKISLDIYRADDSYEMSRLIFYKNNKIYLKVSSVAVLIGALRVNSR